MSLLGKWFGFAADEIYEEGMAAYDRGAYDDALEALEQYAEEGGDVNLLRLARFAMVQCHAQLAAAEMRRGTPGVAVRHLEAALSLCPHFPDLNLAAAQAYHRLGSAPRRDHHLRQALRINPRYYEAMVFEAEVLYAGGEYARALARLLDACEIAPNERCDLFAAVLDACERGFHEQALQNLRAFVPDANGDARLYIRLGDSFMRDHLYAEAMEQYRKALRLAPEYADVHYKLGRLYLETDQPEEAALAFSEALRINETYADAHAQLGVALRRLRKEREAQRSFQRALEINPDHPVAARVL